MEKETFPFYRFFHRLRQEVGIELDLPQYLAFWEIFLGTQPLIKNWDQVLDLCKILWMSRAEYESAFERIFKEEVVQLCMDLKGEKSEIKPFDTVGNPINRNQPNRFTGGSGPSNDPTGLPPADKASVKEPSKLGKRTGSIYLQFSETDQVDGPGGMEAPSAEGALLDNNYLFSEKYSPLLDRRLQQHWKYLRSNHTKVVGTNLDVAGTVKELAQWGRISTPKYLKDRENRPKIVLLVDQSPSMAAFEYMEQHFIAAFRASLPKADIKVGYFYNSPEVVYHQKGLGIHLLIPQKQENKAAIFIFSDAGSARGHNSPERITQTIAFLKQIRPKASTMVWLNPLSEDRWMFSSAEYIAYLVDMLEISPAGMKSLPNLLKRT